MSKSKLEILLEAIEKCNITIKTIDDAYQAYMEERKSIPQAGQEIEVGDNLSALFEKFIGFTANGKIATEDSYGIVTVWNNYRIPTPKKKWKVVRDEDTGKPHVMPFNHPTNLPIITTFED